MEDGACATLGQTVSDSCDVGQQWYDRASPQRCFTASDKEASTDVAVWVLCERVRPADDWGVSWSSVQLCPKLCCIQSRLLLHASQRQVWDQLILFDFNCLCFTNEYFTTLILNGLLRVFKCKSALMAFCFLKWCKILLQCTLFVAYAESEK